MFKRRKISIDLFERDLFIVLTDEEKYLSCGGFYKTLPYGFFTITEKFGYEIYLNNSVSREELLFTLIHEVDHFADCLFEDICEDHSAKYNGETRAYTKGFVIKKALKALDLVVVVEEKQKKTKQVVDKKEEVSTKKKKKN